MRRGFSKLELAVVCGALVLVFGCCGGLAGSTAFLEAPFRVLFGWVPFLRRALPRVTVNPTGIATFALLLAALAAVAHRLGRRAWPGELGSVEPGRGWSGRSTAAACGLTVALFAAGVAATGFGHQLGWLLRSPVPLTERSNPARRSQSQNNLKQIGLAVHNYHADFDRLPAGGTFAPSGRGRHGWTTRALPYLDERDLFDAVNWDQPWDAPANRPIFIEPLPSLRSPYRDLPAEDASGYALAHYAGNARVLTDGAGLRLDDIEDGAAQTLLAGEVAAGFLPWGHPANARDPAVGLNRPAGFGGPRGSGVTQAAMADGSVRALSPDLDPAVLKALATPAGGEAVARGDF